MAINLGPLSEEEYKWHQNGLDIEEMKLSKIKLSAYLKWSEMVKDRIEVRVGQTAEDFLTDQITQLATVQVYGRRVQTKVDVHTSWFQHFKESYFPEFLIRRFPIKKKEILLDYSQVFPSIPVHETSMVIVEPDFFTERTEDSSPA